MKAEKKLVLGGQAIIEGVLVRSPNYISMAVQKEKKIISHHKKIKKKPKFYKFFFIRGIVNLVEMLTIGFKALTWSADQQLGKEEKLKKSELAFSFTLSIIFGILLFVAFPLYITKLIHKDTGFIFNLIDGIMRVAVFLIYIMAISYFKDVKRLFQYHGAEHMSIHCYEAEQKLTVKNVRKFSTLHPRCGTSFMIIVLIISIIVFSIITSDNFFIKFVARILLLPVIAGLSYELLKYSAKYEKNPLMKLIVKPGLWLQKITTKDPDDSMIEVALASLKNVIKLEKK